MHRSTPRAFPVLLLAVVYAGSVCIEANHNVRTSFYRPVQLHGHHRHSPYYVYLFLLPQLRPRSGGHPLTALRLPVQYTIRWCPVRVCDRGSQSDNCEIPRYEKD